MINLTIVTNVTCISISISILAFVNSSCIGAIIGKRGATKQRIEIETKTDIRVPGRNGDDTITIRGKSSNTVAAARRRIETIVSGIRHKNRPTHFTCAKIDNNGIREKFLKFKVAPIAKFKYTCDVQMRRLT